MKQKQQETNEMPVKQDVEQISYTQEVKQAVQNGDDKENTLLQNIGLVQYSMDFLKSPEDATLKWEPDRYGEMTKKRITAICQIIANETGENIDEILNPNTRTPKQKQQILEISGALQIKRIHQFLNSNYMQALDNLKDIKGKYNDTTETDLESNSISIKEISVLIFFALNEDIKPDHPRNLTANQLKEVINIFFLTDRFYFEEHKNQETTEEIDLKKFIEWFCENYHKAENPNLPVIITKKIQDVLYPLDKVNTNLWTLEPGEKVELKAESDKDSAKGKQASIYLLLDFEEMNGTGVTLSRPLTSYDKRVFLATSNLKYQKHDTVTATQIYEAMGNRGRPSAKQREKILKSIETMSVCRVTLDNSEEVKLYTKYDKVDSTFYLLPVTIDKGYVNGLVVDDAITILELPRLLTFAKKRGQFAPTPVSLLESPISQTEANLSLEDYLLTRILRMKNATKKNKKAINTILLDTIYKNCTIKSKMQRSRATEKIERLLTHYAQQEFIKKYEITDKAIEINL